MNSFERQQAREAALNFAHYSQGDDHPYVNATDDDARRWQSQGLCIHCGSPDNNGKCVCRWCDSCSRTWVTDVLADYRETNWGLMPGKEECAKCKESNGE